MALAILEGIRRPIRLTDLGRVFNPMSATNTEPSCVDWGYGTVESANSVYGPMPVGSSTTFTQSFATGTPSQMISKKSTVMHALRKRVQISRRASIPANDSEPQFNNLFYGSYAVFAVIFKGDKVIPSRKDIRGKA